MHGGPWQGSFYHFPRGEAELKIKIFSDYLTFVCIIVILNALRLIYTCPFGISVVCFEADVLNLCTC